MLGITTESDVPSSSLTAPQYPIDATTEPKQVSCRGVGGAELSAVDDAVPLRAMTRGPGDDGARFWDRGDSQATFPTEHLYITHNIMYSCAWALLYKAQKALLNEIIPCSLGNWFPQTFGPVPYPSSDPVRPGFRACCGTGSRRMLISRLVHAVRLTPVWP